MIPQKPSITPYARHPLSIARIVWKRRTQVIVVWLALGSAVIPVVRLIPKTYQAEVTILVDSQKIPEKFISSTVNTSVQDKLATISQQIMSTKNLLKIIESLNLYQEEQTRLSQEDVLFKMRRSIRIAPMQGQQGGFSISFEGKDPVEIARVANQLGDQLVKENVQTREAQAEGTTEFIRTELDVAKRRLDEQEARVSQYKMSHNGELPQQEASLQAVVGRLQGQYQSSQDAITRAYQSKASLESLLQVVGAARSKPGRDSDQSKVSGEDDASAAAQNGQKPLEAAEAELEQLLKRFTESHPRVKRLRETIARLKKLDELEHLQHLDDGSGDRGKSLQAQLAALDREIRTREEQSQKLLKQIESEQGRIQSLPIREQEMLSMTRDYEISKGAYMSLLDKIYSAEMATNLERKQKAERFSVLNSAQVPQKPSKPNEPAVIGGGLAIALGLSVFLALGRGLSENTFLGEWEFPAGVIVLGRVPEIEQDVKGGSGLRKWSSRVAGLALPLCAALASQAVHGFNGIHYV
jgi:polysaccharide biosynthesis transport protein